MDALGDITQSQGEGYITNACLKLCSILYLVAMEIMGPTRSSIPVCTNMISMCLNSNLTGFVCACTNVYSPCGVE